MNLREEVSKRIVQKDSVYQLIGAEIKIRRKALSKTLSSVATNTCSLSYLCKIEKNSIIPNRNFLMEICKKVDISNDKLNALLDSKNILIQMVKSYFYLDYDYIISMKESICEFSNYRSSIARLIYCIVVNKLDESRLIIKELMHIIKEISDFDLAIFITFYGIYNYLICNYLEASDAFKSILDYAISIEELIFLQEKFLFLCAYKADSINVGRYYSICMNRIKTTNLYTYINEINYYYSIYCLKHQQLDIYEEVSIGVRDEVKKSNLNILYNIVVNNYKNIIIDEKSDIEFKLLLEYYIDEDSFIKKLDLEILESIDDSTFVFLKYLESSLISLEVEYEFLTNIAIKESVRKQDFFMVMYYFNKLRKHFKIQGKYKLFYDLYGEVLKLEGIVKQI